MRTIGVTEQDAKRQGREMQEYVLLWGPLMVTAERKEDDYIK